jgi:hypothetical protein
MSPSYFDRTSRATDTSAASACLTPAAIALSVRIALAS